MTCLTTVLFKRTNMHFPRERDHSSSSEINGVRSSVEVVVVAFHLDHFKLYHSLRGIKYFIIFC